MKKFVKEIYEWIKENALFSFSVFFFVLVFVFSVLFTECGRTEKVHSNGKSASGTGINPGTAEEPYTELRIDIERLTDTTERLQESNGEFERILEEIRTQNNSAE